MLLLYADKESGRKRELEQHKNAVSAPGHTCGPELAVSAPGHTCGPEFADTGSGGFRALNDL